MDNMEVLPPQEVLPVQTDDFSSLESIIRQAAANGALPVEVSDSLFKVTAKLKARSTQELRRQAVLSALVKKYDFLKIDSLKNNTELCLWYKSNETDTYRPFDITTAEELVEAEYANIGVECTEKDAETMRGMVRIKRWPHARTLDDRLIKVTNDYFWDRSKGSLVKDIYSLYDYDYKGVFRELFDGDAGGDTAPDVHIEDVHISPSNVNTLYRYISNHNGEFLPPTILPDPEELRPLPDDFDSEVIYENMAPILASKLAEDLKRVLDVFWVWANNSSKDTMNDLLKVPVYLFLKEMPKRFLILDGDRRNGKSAFITLLETILGGNNCTEIPMKAMIDPHKANDLIRSWANLPREDYDFDAKDMKEGVAFLKNVATHEPVSISNYYKQSSSRVTPRFLAAFPRNGTPDFGNVEGNAAVMIRMRAIRFENDLSAMDNSGRNFEKETYTPEFCATYVEMILAMAKYYNEHTFDFSITSRNFGQRLQAITDPATFYMDQVSKWFDYVGNVGFATQQAELYFNNQGFDWNGEVMRAIKAKLRKMNTAKVLYFGHDGRKQCLKVPKNKDYPERIKVLAEDAIIAALGNKTPEEYRSSLNRALASMTPQQAYDKKLLSVIEVLEEFDENEHHAGPGSAVRAQKLLEENDVPR